LTNLRKIFAASYLRALQGTGRSARKTLRAIIKSQPRQLFLLEEMAGVKNEIKTKGGNDNDLAREAYE